MKISSNYYDYYSQFYQVNTTSNVSSTSTEAANSTSSETEAVSSVGRRRPIHDMYENNMDLNVSGRAMMNSIKMKEGEGQVSSGDNNTIKTSMDKVKSDMDSIKNADIDSMSEEDLKETLSNLINDLQSVPKPYGKANNSQTLDVDSMSESDIKSMLKKIQEKATMVQEDKNAVSPPENFKNVDEDIDSIAAMDIESMSEEELRATLKDFKTDLEAIKRPGEMSDSAQQTDLDSMSEDDLRELLEKIQEQAAKEVM